MMHIVVSSLDEALIKLLILGQLIPLLKIKYMLKIKVGNWEIAMT